MGFSYGINIVNSAMHTRGSHLRVVYRQMQSKWSQAIKVVCIDDQGIRMKCKQQKSMDQRSFSDAKKVGYRRPKNHGSIFSISVKLYMQVANSPIQPSCWYGYCGNPF